MTARKSSSCLSTSQAQVKRWVLPRASPGAAMGEQHDTAKRSRPIAWRYDVGTMVGEESVTARGRHVVWIMWSRSRIVGDQPGAPVADRVRPLSRHAAQRLVYRWPSTWWRCRAVSIQAARPHVQEHRLP